MSQQLTLPLNDQTDLEKRTQSNRTGYNKSRLFLHVMQHVSANVILSRARSAEQLCGRVSLAVAG